MPNKTSNEVVKNVPSFNKFVDLLQQKVFSEMKDIQAKASFRNLVVQTGSSVTTLSLDKLYRFYVNDLVTHPEYGEAEALLCVKKLINKHLGDTSRKPMFRVKETALSHQCTLEQCCIR